MRTITATLNLVIMAGMLVLVTCKEVVPPLATAVPPTQIITAEPTQSPIQEPISEPIVEIEEPTAEPIGPPEIFLTVWTEDLLGPILIGAAEPFQAAYGLGLVVEPVHIDEIRDRVAAAIPAGDGPDIFIGSHNWLGQFVSASFLAPLDLGDQAIAFSDNSLAGCTVEGDLYCLPYAVGNLAFVYNTDLVETPPATWNEVIETGAALQAEGLVQFGLALSNEPFDTFPLQTAFGGYLFGLDEAGNDDPGDIGIDGEGMIAAGNWIAARVDEGFMPGNVDWETSHALFERGELPFLMTGPDALDRNRASGIPYAVANFPDGGRPFITVQGFMVNALSENALLAQIFLIDFVAINDIMVEISTATNKPSAFVPALEAMNDIDLIAFAEAGSNGVLLPSIPEIGLVWGPWSEAMSRILNGQDTPESALTRAAEQIRTEISGSDE